MTTKHTPGTWQSEWPDFGDHRYVASTVSTVCDETAVCTLRADQEADARLIAAAPDLLESAKPFDAGAWFAEGVLRDHRSDGLKITLTLEGTTYDPITATVGELRALSAAIAKAEDKT